MAVIYDVKTLTSLPAKEIRSGYAEIVKHGFISRKAFLDQIMKTNLRNTLDPYDLVDQLQKGIAVKARIVEQDEKENDIRKFLNFGHTLGHAIEAELGYGNITHGEAVAIGMLFAIRVSEQIFQVELPYDSLLQWLKENNYPLTISSLNIEHVIDRMKLDKKSENAIVQMVLLEKIGQPKIVNLEDQVLKKHLEIFIRELG